MTTHHCLIRDEQITVEDCPCYRRGKNNLDWHRVPEDAEE